MVSTEPELTFAPDQVLQPYSTLAVPFTFRPQRPAEARVALRLEFDNPNCPPMRVVVEARGLSVPIYVEKQIMDFKTCMFGKL